MRSSAGTSPSHGLTSRSNAAALLRTLKGIPRLVRVISVLIGVPLGCSQLNARLSTQFRASVTSRLESCQLSKLNDLWLFEALSNDSIPRDFRIPDACHIHPCATCR